MSLVNSVMIRTPLLWTRMYTLFNISTQMLALLAQPALIISLFYNECVDFNWIIFFSFFN